MKSTIALLRVALPSRVALLVAILAICGCVLVLAPAYDGTSVEKRSSTIVLLEFALLPVIAAMLGGALLRGEHAAWSWALARPVGRTHWCAVQLALDVSTLVLGALAIDTFLGDPPKSITYDIFRSTGLEPFQDLGVGAVIVLAYLGGAFGASRGHSTMRGFPIACAYAFCIFLTSAVVLWLDTLVARVFVVDAWPMPDDAGLLREPSGSADIRFLITGMAIVLASLGGFAHVIGRALSRVPGRLARREVLAVFALWIVGAALLAWSLRSPLWTVMDAPLLARRGDAQVEIVDPDGVGVPHRVVLVAAECERCFARSTSIHGLHRTGRFADVVPGRYRVCRLEELPSGTRRGLQTSERCVDTVLVAGSNLIEPDFAATSATRIPADRPMGWEHDSTFEHLMFLRGPVDMIGRAVREPELTTIRGAPTIHHPAAR